MKLDEKREFVTRLTKVALTHAGCNSLRAAIGKEVNQTLAKVELEAYKAAAPEGYEFVGMVHDEATYRKIPGPICTCSAKGPCVNHL